MKLRAGGLGGEAVVNNNSKHLTLNVHNLFFCLTPWQLLIRGPLHVLCVYVREGKLFQIMQDRYEDGVKSTKS